MKTLIILGSARKDSHTRTLLKNVFEGVDHELIDLLDYKIAPFDYGGKYPEGDQFLDLAKRMVESTHVVYATPVYWYAMSGILKNFIDRFTDLTSTQKELGRSLAGTKVFLFTVGSDMEPVPGFETPFIETSKYFGMKYVKGVYLSSRSENFEGVQMAVNVFRRELG